MITKNRLDEEQIEEIREIFSHYDHNGDGVIQASEFGALLRALDDQISDDEIETGLRAIDGNRNGIIEFDEFLDWWSGH